MSESRNGPGYSAHMITCIIIYGCSLGPSLDVVISWSINYLRGS